MIVLVALVAIFGLCNASDPDYAPHNTFPKFIPLDLIAEPLLEQLATSLDNLEERETSQLSKLDTLIDEANLNTEFANRFNEVILPNYEFHQKQQNQRLDNLEDRIAEIEALRARTQDLQNAATAINDQVNNQVYPARKQIMYDLDHLRNIHLEFNADLEETQERADAINDLIDALCEKIALNTRQLQQLDNSRKQVTTEINAQRSGGSRVIELFPNTEEDSALVNFTALGAPQFTQNTIIGFDLVKKRSYQYAYPSIYLGVYASVDNDQTAIESTDVGSGGWTANSVLVSSANAYIATGELVFPKLNDRKP